MTAPANLSREAALRIALAARVLPGIGVARLLDVLQQRLAELSEEGLRSITVTDLKTGFASADGEEDGEDISIGLPAIKDAVRILWGESASEQLPKPMVLEQPPEGSIRVAIASNTAERMDGHFGSCLRFLVYQVSPESCTLVDVRSALEAELAEDRNAFRAELINDCQVLYVISIGGPAAAKVVRAGIYPIKRIDSSEAVEVISELQQVLRGAPPPWLAKLLGADAQARVRFSLADEAG